MKKETNKHIRKLTLWEKAKRFYFLAIIILVLLAIFILISSDEMLANSIMVNKIAMMGLLLSLLISLPGFIAEEFTTKKYRLKGKCPYCKKDIELIMTEEK